MMTLARRVAAAVQRRYPGVENDDLVGAALEGMLRAQRNYNPQRGVSLEDHCGLAARNYARNEAAKLARWKREQDPGEPVWENLPDPAPSPEEAGVHAALWQEIWDRVQRLPRRQREILLWRYFSGPGLRPWTDLPPDKRSAAKMAEQRGLKKLRAEMQEGPG